MTDALSRLLDTRDWLLADGATGTNLFNMGLSSGDAPEMWNIDHPDRIRALYEGAVQAGSDLFLTNSFGANTSRLKLHGADGRVRELNRVAAELGREVADAAGRPVIVAGSVGPTGEIMEPMGSLTYDSAVEIFHEQAEGLKDNAENQHESVSFSHGILAKTERLKVIAAILPGPWKPALAAKQLATIDHLSNGRIAINVVSGWFRGEFDAIGEEWPEHDERYARSEEFIRSLKGVWS